MERKLNQRELWDEIVKIILKVDCCEIRKSYFPESVLDKIVRDNKINIKEEIYGKMRERIISKRKQLQTRNFYFRNNVIKIPNKLLPGQTLWNAIGGK